jgi:DNA processing protein
VTQDIWLCRIIDRLPLSPKGKRTLAGKVSSYEELAAMDPFQAEFNAGVRLSGDFNPRRARDLVLRDMDRRLGALTLHDPSYPDLLREIHDPPFVLYYRGELPDWNRAVAVVGTRRPTADALRETWRYAIEMALAGRPVVSGLALGIDAAAHRGALAGSGHTVAVMAGGLEQIYPLAHKTLAGKILAEGGALVSEFSGPGIPGRHLFPRRNRIISGLCPLTVVAQAPARSGALITADYALDQGRDVAILACGLDPLRGEGTRRLASEGAQVLGQTEPFRLRPVTEPRTGADLVRMMDLELKGKLFCGYGGHFVGSDN